MRYGAQTRRWDPLLWLLGIMLACYFVQVFCQVVLKNDAATAFLSMTPEGLANLRLWTPLTYAFAHGGPLHLIFNLLIIYMVGRVVEVDLGHRRFIWACIFSAFGGALLFLIFHVGTAHTALLGASAIAMGLMTIYCLARPDEPVTFLIFFVFPVSLRPRVLLIVMTLIEVIMLTAELQGMSEVASSAHLGGIGAGLLYYRKAVLGQSLFPYPRKRGDPRIGSQRRPIQSPRFMVNITSRGAMRSEVDRILDKINSQGFGSLTEEEKQTLDKAKDILSK